MVSRPLFDAIYIFQCFNGLRLINRVKKNKFLRETNLSLQIRGVCHKNRKHFRKQRRSKHLRGTLIFAIRV